MKTDQQPPKAHATTRHLPGQHAIGVFQVRLEDDFIEYTPSFATIITGAPTPFLTRADFIRHIHPLDMAIRQKAYADALDSGEVCYETRTIWDDGSVHWIRTVGSYLFDDDGLAYRFLGTVQDITDQRLETMSLQAAEARFRTIVEQAPFAVMLLRRRELIIEIVNDGMQRIMGKKASVVGKSFLEALPEMVDQPFPALMLQVYDSGETYYGKNVIATLEHNGVMRVGYFDCVYSPTRDATGIVNGIIVVATEVTDQVLARQATEKSEARFRSLIEEAPFATALYRGRELIIEVANQEMMQIWGKDWSVIGKPLAEALPELAGQPFLPLLDHVFTTGETYHGQAEPATLDRNGELETSYYRYIYKPLLSEDGVVYAILNMAVDVTEQVNQQRRLKESELFARSIIDNSPVAKVVFFGDNLTMKVANNRMLEMMSRDSSVIGKPLLEIVPELRDSAFVATLYSVLQTGKPAFDPEQAVTYTRGGKATTGYFNYIFTALPDIVGRIYGVIVTATDVTEQVLARQKIQEAEEALRSAVEIAELGTWSVNLISRKVALSARMQQWFGLAAKDWYSDEDVLGAISIKDVPAVRVAIQEAKNPRVRSIFDMEYNVQDLARNERIIHAQGRAYFNEMGVAIKISGTARDVTKQRKLQTALEQQVGQRTEQLQTVNNALLDANLKLAQTNERLLRSNEELAQYAYVASHDLQEPLRKIQIFTDMLGRDEHAQSGRGVLIQKINRSAARMSLLIRDLLSLSRLLHADHMYQRVALKEIVQNVITDFELQIIDRKARVEVGTLPPIDANALQMNQLFNNLLSNALKFTRPDETPVVNIHARFVTDGLPTATDFKPKSGVRYLYLTFSDNGIGFDEAYAEQVFIVFKRLHERDVFPGSGIGLALCRRIITNHHGYIYVTSKVGVGTTFHIYLPEQQAHGDKAP